jgi:dolichol-phosphate mannosyltransferase
MTRALVTGAAGFVGANLARRLIVDGHDVHVLDRPGSRSWRLDELPGTATIHEVDLEDGEAVTRAVQAARPEWIFHLAARGAYSWQGDVGEILRVNVLGTANLLEAAAGRGFDAFVYAGTSSEYGFKDHAPDESESIDPTSAYAVAKASATMLCRLFAERTERRIVSLRLYSTFGPWEEPGRLLPNVILNGLEGGLPPLVSPDAAHDFVYVDDVVEAFLLAARGETVAPGAIFNVGTGVQTTLAEVIALALRTFDVAEEPSWGTMEAKPWDTGVWVADSSRIRRELGWSPRSTFAEGFERQVEWFRANSSLWPLYRELVEQRRARRRAS